MSSAVFNDELPWLFTHRLRFTRMLLRASLAVLLVMALSAASADAIPSHVTMPVRDTPSLADLEEQQLQMDAARIQAELHAGWDEAMKAYEAGDYETAVAFFRQKAEEGDARAQFNLALCYEDGTGVAKDKAEAVKWYTKSAEQDDAMAQLNLGLCYQFGEGVAKDETTAFMWFKKAAEVDDERAPYLVGCGYLYGIGVRPDVEQAVIWLKKAARHGDRKAIELLKTQLDITDFMP